MGECPPKDSQRTAGRASADQHDHRAIANDLRDRQAPQAVPEDPMLFVQNLREPKAEVDPFELEEAERLINSATGQVAQSSPC